MIRPLLHTVVLWGALAITLPAAAQYDRDGRYVPSPMGVPTDPYARPVPLSSGAPGSKGEPIWPRGMIPETARAPNARPVERGTPQYTQSARARAFYRAFKQCSNLWTATSGISRAEHNRRCREEVGQD
jgi:hypothetical protein